MRRAIAWAFETTASVRRSAQRMAEARTRRFTPRISRYPNTVPRSACTWTATRASRRASVVSTSVPQLWE